MPSSTKLSSKSKKQSPPKSKRDVSDDEEDQSSGREDGIQAEYDSEGNEIYVVEKILKAEKGYYKPGQWAFEVKWQGYSETENSWVSEKDFGDPSTVQAYWEANPHIKGNPHYAQKGLGKIRKSDVKLEKSTSRSSLALGAKSGRKSDAKRQESSEEPMVDTMSSKRKSVKAATAEVDDDDDIKMVPAPAPKKSKKSSTINKKKFGEAASPTPAADENGRDGSMEYEDEKGAHSVEVMADKLHLESWDDLVAEIQTVEKKGGSSHDLMIYFLTVKGEKAVVDVAVFREKAPRKLLYFYENHLRWRNKDGE